MTNKKRKGESYRKVGLRNQKNAKKNAKLGRRHKRQRSARLQKAEEDNPLVTTNEVVCLSKRSFETRLAAFKAKPRKELSCYECSVCSKWHYTGMKEQPSVDDHLDQEL